MVCTIKRNWLGKLKVHYHCPFCNAELASPSEEAGRIFPCPTCQKEFKVPGEAELERQRKAELEATLKANEQARRTEVELQARREAAKAARAERAADSPTRQKSNTGASAADRFLLFTFKFAKAVSVVIVALCFAAIVVCVVMLVMVKPEPPRSEVTEVKKLVGASSSDYQDFLGRSRASDQTTNAGRMASAGNADSSQSAGDATLPAIVHELLPFSLGEASITPWVQQLDPQTEQTLLDGLRAFIRDGKQSGHPVDHDAVVWFFADFQTRIAEVEESKRQAEQDAARAAEERSDANAAATEEREQLVMAIGGALAGLLSFLFLPLLIQIERNTRHRKAGHD